MGRMSRQPITAHHHFRDLLALLPSRPVNATSLIQMCCLEVENMAPLSSLQIARVNKDEITVLTIRVLSRPLCNVENDPPALL